MPHSYAPQFRAMIIEQVRSGRRVADVAASVEVPEATVFRWVRQDKIDRGEIPGTSSQELTELRAATRRITELEAELAYGQARAGTVCRRAGGAPKSPVPHRGGVGR